MFKLSSTCSHTHSKSLSPLCNCFINYALVQLGGMKPGVSTFSRKFDSFASPMHRGPILLKCEVIGVSLLLNMGQKISRKQYVSTILTIHLNTGIKEVKFVRPSTDTPPVELPKVETPDFIPPNLWPPNSPDLNPVDYKIKNGFTSQALRMSTSYDTGLLRNGTSWTSA